MMPPSAARLVRFWPVSLGLFVLSGCQHYDKAAHFAVGAAVSHVVAKETDSKMAGCAAAVGLGVLKELVDNYADPLDVVATGLGCLVTVEAKPSP